MSNSNETGIHKNVANFDKLMDVCKELSTKYNPGAKDISLDGLNSYYNLYFLAEQKVDVAKATYDNAVNDRVNIFSTLKALSTGILNQMRTSGADPLRIKDAEGHNRKVQGRRAEKLKEIEQNPALPPIDSEKQAVKRSISQLSYDNLISHFDSLIKTVETEPNYAPNEAEFSIAGLKAKLDEMNQVNKLVNSMKIAWQNAIIYRNFHTNDAKIGLVAVAGRVKSYLRSVCGTRSKEVLIAVSLQFRNI